MDYQFIRSKIFKDYLRHVYGEELSRFQIDKKIIFFKDNEWRSDRSDYNLWVMYIDLQDEIVFLIKEQKSYSFDEFVEKLNNLKIFL